MWKESEGEGEEWQEKIQCWLIMGCVSKFQGESYENWAISARVHFCGDHEDSVPLIYILRALTSVPEMVGSWVFGAGSDSGDRLV